MSMVTCRLGICLFAIPFSERGTGVVVQGTIKLFSLFLGLNCLAKLGLATLLIHFMWFSHFFWLGFVFLSVVFMGNLYR
jgi:hypothetical protein